MSSQSYLRFPDIRGDQVVFVAEDDVWLVGREGGRAFRLSADQLPAQSPRLSPDGSRVAWTATSSGAREVYVAPTEGGVSKRLTFWGRPTTAVRGWVSDDEVLAVSAVGEAEEQRRFAHAVPIDGGPSRRLPYGWLDDIAFAPDGGVLLATAAFVEPAWWKRYRGGTAGQLWLDRSGSGDFKRLFAELTSGLACPLWTRGPDGKHRIGFISDHDGVAQVYSAPVGRRPPATSQLTRHTDLEFYARHASSDGEQVVYVAGGDLYLLDSLDPVAEPRRIDVRLGGPRTALKPRTVKADAEKLETVRPDRTGRASAVEIRGTIHWLTHREGPARALADGSAVRRRLPVVVGDTGRVAWVSDEHSDDAVLISALDDVAAEPALLVAAGKVGRVLELAAAPDGSLLAVAAHDGRLLVVEVPIGDVGRPQRVREVDSTVHGDVSGLAFSPDSRWLAWSTPGPEPLRHIRMVEVGRSRAKPFDVTPLRFTDTEPVFTLDGRHLAFLSVRSLDPVYDAFVFDLSFPDGCRPHLVPLAALTPSPFDPRLGGRPVVAPEAPKPAGGDGGGATSGSPAGTTVDVEGLDQRITPVPVVAGRYSHLCAVEGGLVWLKQPVKGELGEGLAKPGDEAARSTLEHIDFATGRTQTLADAADAVVASGDGSRLVIADKDKLTVLPATRKVERTPDAPSDDVVEVDLERLRITVEPRAEWTQMFHEAWRLMRDHFWRPDMAGVDWAGVRDRYAPLLDRIGSHNDLVDLIWEMQGELGSSHAYVWAPPPSDEPGARLGLLGADLEFEGDAWRIGRIIPGESSARQARSPLSAPGVAASAGDAVVAVDGRPTSLTVSPGSLLVGTSNKPVELTLLSRDGDGPRRVVVVPLADEQPLRYHDWVNDRRAYVHAQADGRVGYVHVPDMVSGGWAQLHRDLRTEVGRDALIVDVRGNSGGHTSQLVVEKLARRIIGWDLSRGHQPQSYPGDARRGPMVTVTDMYAGSDGDIVTAAIQSLGLGPVIGTRTWGGVIGIDGRYKLVDGTKVTQPRYAFWFERFGWGVENHGVDPDIEVVARPQDLVAGTDVQLDYALKLVRQQLKKTPALTPPPLPDL